MKILLTGATGFIGKNLVSYLNSKNISVDNINRDVLKNEKKLDDFVKSKHLKMKKHYDVLIHLAAELDNSSKKLIPVNVTLTKKLLKLCVKNGIDRFIFASSHLVYGKTDYLPIDEEHPTKPKTNYGKSKFLAEEICKTYSKNFNLKTSILRISSVYGYGQNAKYIIPRMLNDLCSKNITLHKYANGYQLMDLIHVNDVCNAILKSCKSKKTGIYNLSSGVGITPLELAKTISALTNDCVISTKNRKSETNHFLYDVSKIQQEIGFKSKIKPNSKILKPWLQKILRAKKQTVPKNLNNKRKY